MTSENAGTQETSLIFCGPCPPCPDVGHWLPLPTGVSRDGITILRVSPDGGFRYQGSPAGEEEHGSYKNWDNTGTYLLTYALPLRSLYLTGKKRCSVPVVEQVLKLFK